MKQYTVRSGQNIYDVALTLHGTVEGIFDLLVSNDWLSMDTKLKHGMTLNYHEEFVINQHIVSWLEERGVLVKNGEHTYSFQDIEGLIKNHIITEHKDEAAKIEELSPDEQSQYWDELTLPVMIIVQQGQSSVITVSVKKDCHLFIDWGDYTEVLIVEDESQQDIEHAYKSNGVHHITLYGNAKFDLLDLTEVSGVHYPLRTIEADTFKDVQKTEELNQLIITK